MSRHTLFGGRTLARSQALQLLFQAEATGRSVDEVLSGDYTLEMGPLDEHGERLARGADEMRHDLDAVLSMTARNWSLRRMPAVDRNLLRLAVFEMLEVDEVDVPIAIDECVELAKAYGTPKSSRFINGVLGKVASYIDNDEDVIAIAREYMLEQARQQDVTGVEDDDLDDADDDEFFDDDLDGFDTVEDDDFDDEGSDDLVEDAEGAE